MQQSSAKVESTEDTITGYVPIPGIGCELGEKKMSSLLGGGHQADVGTWKVCVSWGGEGKHPQQPWEKQIHHKAPPRLGDGERARRRRSTTGSSERFPRASLCVDIGYVDERSHQREQ